MQTHFWTLGDLLAGILSIARTSSGISTFGRVDYNLNTDINGFDHHIVAGKSEQRHCGICCEKLIAT